MAKLPIPPRYTSGDFLDRLAAHLGHRVVTTTDAIDANLALPCEDCATVLADTGGDACDDLDVSVFDAWGAVVAGTGARRFAELRARYVAP